MQRVIRQQDEKLVSLDEKVQAQSNVIRFQREQLLEQGRRIDVLERQISTPKQETNSKPQRNKGNSLDTSKEMNTNVTKPHHCLNVICVIKYM